MKINKCNCKNKNQDNNKLNATYINLLHANHHLFYFAKHKNLELN